MTKLVCSVDTCVHNCDHYCCKNNIKVDGERAEAPASTCCSSFDEKKGSRCCNSYESPEESLEVACDAANCMYNKAQKCTASSIGIAGSGAKKMEQTECATFRKA